MFISKIIAQLFAVLFIIMFSFSTDKAWSMFKKKDFQDLNKSSGPGFFQKFFTGIRKKKNKAFKMTSETYSSTSTPNLHKLWLSAQDSQYRASGIFDVNNQVQTGDITTFKPDKSVRISRSMDCLLDAYSCEVDAQEEISRTLFLKQCISIRDAQIELLFSLVGLMNIEDFNRVLTYSEMNEVLHDLCDSLKKIRIPKNIERLIRLARMAEFIVNDFLDGKFNKEAAEELLFLWLSWVADIQLEKDKLPPENYSVFYNVLCKLERSLFFSVRWCASFATAMEFGCMINKLNEDSFPVIRGKCTCCGDLELLVFNSDRVVMLNGIYQFLLEKKNIFTFCDGDIFFLSK